MEVSRTGAHHPKTFAGASGADDLGEVSWAMTEDILPDGPAERRRRNRLYALRAMDRLGLLGEENLIPTLASRPNLRWLADEEGARMEVLAELGRIRAANEFEAAVGWLLENRPRTEQAKAEIRRFRTDSPTRVLGQAVNPGGPRDGWRGRRSDTADTPTPSTQRP
jgi:hypothetical protein